MCIIFVCQLFGRILWRDKFVTNVEISINNNFFRYLLNFVLIMYIFWEASYKTQPKEPRCLFNSFHSRLSCNLHQKDIHDTASRTEMGNTVKLENTFFTCDVMEMVWTDVYFKNIQVDSRSSSRRTSPGRFHEGGFLLNLVNENSEWIGKTKRHWERSQTSNHTWKFISRCQS